MKMQTLNLNPADTLEMVKKAICSVGATCYLLRLDGDIGYSQGAEESGLVFLKAYKIK